MSIPKQYRNIARLLEIRIAKQERFLETWNPILDTLKTKEPSEAVQEVYEFIAKKVEHIDSILSDNRKELAELQAKAE